MNYLICALVEDGIVVNAISCSDVEWVKSALPGNWIPIVDKQCCIIGDIWDGENFIPPEPEGGEE